jgi:transcriptional regulator with XRE-family HTH domain
MAFRWDIGKQIALSRKSMGLTQQQASEITRINKTTLSEIENGRFSGSFSIFERYVDAVGLEFEVVEKVQKFPDWDEIEVLFSEDD